MEWLCHLEVHSGDIKDLGPLTEPAQAGVEKAGPCLRLIELWVCGHSLNVLAGFGGLTGNHPHIHK